MKGNREAPALRYERYLHDPRDPGLADVVQIGPDAVGA